MTEEIKSDAPVAKKADVKLCYKCGNYSRPKCKLKDIFTARKKTCEDWKKI